MPCWLRATPGGLCVTPHSDSNESGQVVVEISRLSQLSHRVVDSRGLTPLRINRLCDATTNRRADLSLILKPVARESVGGNGEVDGDLGFGFDGFGAFEVRFEVPLADGVLGGGS